MENIPSFQRINFSKNWNNKLNCFFFTTIRPVSEKYKSGERFDIRINDVFYCYADLIEIKTLTISQITERNYNILDSGLNASEFYDLMSKFYSKKKWWKERETTLQTLFLKKLVQFDIFDVIEEKI